MLNGIQAGAKRPLQSMLTRFRPKFRRHRKGAEA